MKFRILAFGLLVAFASCNNEASTENETTATEEAVTEETSAVAANVDPVCGMTHDSSWEEYSVTDGDTTWFCSSTCKAAFEGNPAKYQKQEEHDGHEGHEEHDEHAGHNH
ncbi:MAG: YHS domain-containing protein [Flavipsychrobacter sp.]